MIMLQKVVALAVRHVTARSGCGEHVLIGATSLRHRSIYVSGQPNFVVVVAARFV